MIEFVNRNLEKTEPEYFYRVSEFVTTFGMDEGKNEPFSHFEDFKGNDLHECKAKAEKYYWERLEGLEQGKYFLPLKPLNNLSLVKMQRSVLPLHWLSFTIRMNIMNTLLLAKMMTPQPKAG